MRLIVIRHGKCIGLDKSIINGWEDFPLTEVGIKEAKDVGVKLSKMYPQILINEVYTSYLSRTYSTAKCILETLNQGEIHINQDLRLNERHYGFFQGMTRTVARTFKEYNTLSESYRRIDNKLIPISDELYDKQVKEYVKKLNMPEEKVIKLMPKSESIRDVEIRLNSFLKDIMKKKNKDKTILIVTHANPIKLISKYFEKLNYKQTNTLRFATCGMKIFDFDYDSSKKTYILKNVENINKEWTY